MYPARIWHYSLLDVLPDSLLKQLWKNCIAWSKELAKPDGKFEYPIAHLGVEEYRGEFLKYCNHVLYEMVQRKLRVSTVSIETLEKNTGFQVDSSVARAPVYVGWHGMVYLRTNMAMLFDMHYLGEITDAEWSIIAMRYQQITGEDYTL